MTKPRTLLQELEALFGADPIPVRRTPVKRVARPKLPHKPRKAAVSAAIWEIHRVRRPVSGETIGFRIRVAVPCDVEHPFRAPWLITESSDYTLESEAAAAAPAFLKDLSFMGFTKFTRI